MIHITFLFAGRGTKSLSIMHGDNSTLWMIRISGTRDIFVFENTEYFWKTQTKLVFRFSEVLKSSFA